MLCFMDISVLNACPSMLPGSNYVALSHFVEKLGSGRVRLAVEHDGRPVQTVSAHGAFPVPVPASPTHSRYLVAMSGMCARQSAREVDCKSRPETAGERQRASRLEHSEKRTYCPVEQRSA